MGAFRAAAHLPAGGVRRFQAVALVEHLVREVGGEVELEARRVLDQLAVQVHGAGRLEERADHAAQLAVLVPREHRLAVEPAQGEPMVLAQAHQLVHPERELPLADPLGRALEVGKVVARHLLVRADEEVGELPPGRPRLGEQLGDGRLEEVLGEQERRLERHRRRAAGTLARRLVDLAVAVEEPARLLLEHRGEQAEHVLRRHALAALDHAQVRHRRRGARVELDAARRELLEREAVALAQRAQLRAEEVGLAHVRLLGHEPKEPARCEINTVKFP
jgi:hypothetical protein